MKVRRAPQKPPCRSLQIERLESRYAFDADGGFGPVIGPEPGPEFAAAALSVPQFPDPKIGCITPEHLLAGRGQIGESQNGLVPTDVNWDGAVTVADAFALIDEVIQLHDNAEHTSPLGLAMDVNGDSQVDLQDAFAVVDELRDPGRDTAVALGESLLQELGLPWQLESIQRGEDTHYREQSIGSFGIAIGRTGRGEAVGNSPIQYVLRYATPDCENYQLGMRTVLVNLDESAAVLVARD